MPEQQVPVTRTVVTLRDYVRAVMKSWHLVDQGPCTKGACAVLWAQHMIETGGAACWNFNIGNIKHVKGDGYDYHCLNGVWEGVAPVTAGNLIAAGRAVADPSPDHAKAVGKDKVSVIFPPPQPESRFRAFKSLDDGMADHLKTLARRFAPAWMWVIAGDYRQFAIALKHRGYYTASADAYSAGMRRPYEEAMASAAWDDVRETMEAETLPEVPAVPSSRPSPASYPTIHVDPGWYIRGAPDDEPPPDAA